MRYVSTRGEAPVLGFTDVVLTGLARDGGLYVPQEWVSPAEVGMDAVTSIYVSMGVTPPVSKPPLIQASVAKPKARQAPKTKSSPLPRSTRPGRRSPS